MFGDSMGTFSLLEGQVWACRREKIKRINLKHGHI